MSSLENIQETCCNEGESVTILGKNLSAADICALNKAADILAGNSSSIKERDPTIYVSQASKVGGVAVSRNIVYAAPTIDSQAVQGVLF